MYSSLSFLLTTLLISTIPAVAHLKANEPAETFTIQVASFPDIHEAEMYAARLVSAGENPVCDTIGIEGRGRWTRVFVGIFDTPQAAKQYGDALRSRGVISEFFVKRASPNLDLTRPRRVVLNDSRTPASGGPAPTIARETPLPQARPIINLPALRPVPEGRKSGTGARRRGPSVGSSFEPANAALPVLKTASIPFAPNLDSSVIPRPDPVGLVFRLVTHEPRAGFWTSDHRAGLWIGGDIAEGLSRVRWIVGPENAELVNVDPDGHVILDKKRLAMAAGIKGSGVEAPLKALKYITSNEGLLLLVQISEGRFGYLLHVGRQAPTAGKAVETTGSINLDNNVDSRINPYRKNGKKLDEERPPQCFDSLIGLNPVARWFNLSINSWVQPGEIVFHELAEAHAKLEFGLDYLDHGSRLGAHATAIQREARLKSQRPDADIVITVGSNRLLRTEHEIRLFYAESASTNQR
jgi:sporulation related protein